MFSRNLVFAIAILVVGRVLSFAAYMLMCFTILPEMKEHVVVKSAQITPLIKFGGWITVSNIVSPIMVNFDRFFIGAMVSVSALAYYSTPWEVVARLLIIPASLASVMFPVFSQQKGLESPTVPRLYHKSLNYILMLMFPICLFFAVFAKEVLTLWLGPEFADNSFRVMQVMAIAVLINGLATIPFSLIQAAGRPDITAKFHIAELALYIPLLWLFIKSWGVIGAALAWLVRVAADLSLLEHFARRYSPSIPATGFRNRNTIVVYVSIFVISLAVSEVLIDSLVAKIATTLILFGFHAVVCWKVFLEESEKEYLVRKLRSI